MQPAVLATVVDAVLSLDGRIDDVHQLLEAHLEETGVEFVIQAAHQRLSRAVAHRCAELVADASFATALLEHAALREVGGRQGTAPPPRQRGVDLPLLWRDDVGGDSTRHHGFAAAQVDAQVARGTARGAQLLRVARERQRVAARGTRGHGAVSQES
jgi:hypothetical protein